MAMLLYIVYIEPLLATLEAKIKGLRIENFVQKSEAFCDDVNLLTEHLDDSLVVENVLNKFEMTSVQEQKIQSSVNFILNTHSMHNETNLHFQMNILI